MKVEILFHYMKYCKINDIEPTFQGLHEHKYLIDGVIY